MYRPMNGNLTNLQVLIGVLISQKKYIQASPSGTSSKTHVHDQKREAYVQALGRVSVHTCTLK